MPRLTLDHLKTLDNDKKNEAIFREFRKCRQDPIYCIETYFTVLDSSISQRVPFKLYPHQLRAIQDFEDNRYNMSMKSRQMGFTTVSTAYVAWFMITKPNQFINALAQEKKTSRKFLRTVRETLDNARAIAPWLVADYVFNNNGKDSFTLKTGSMITAEANKPDACRGDTINLLIIDEVAAITHMEEIWASAGITLTKSGGKCIAISTPKGQSGWYFEQYTNAAANGWNIVQAHWSEHPDFSRGMYQFVKDVSHPEGGFIEYLNPIWPDTKDKESLTKYKTKETYSYILDGKIRSPWYDYESKKLGTNKTKCELDCSFSGSGGEVIDSERIRDIANEARKPKNKFINEIGKGIWKSYRVYREFNMDHGYVLSADVATGDGSDYSAFSIVDITTMEIVATYKDLVEPTAYANVIAEAAADYGFCLVITEYQGPGLTVLMELKNRLKYTNLYYHTLKKQDVTKNQKRKLGFWQGDATRTLGGDKLEEIINSGELKIYSEDVINELHTWIWRKDGKRGHAEGKHDDLLMSLTMACFFIYHVKNKRDTANKMMKDHFEFNRHRWHEATNDAPDDFGMYLG